MSGESSPACTKRHFHALERCPCKEALHENTGSNWTDSCSETRCPIARHRTVNARPRTLLVYEGNESHVIKNMAATVNFFSPHANEAYRKVHFVVFRTATVRCRAVPCDQLFSSISFIVRCRAIGQRV